MSFLKSVATATAEHFPVFPLLPDSKVPATKRGLGAATRNTEKIQSWWDRLPDANIGLVTGDGVLGLDVDVKGRVSGFASIASHAWWNGDKDTTWQDTFTVGTPSGGAHYYYRVDGAVKNRAGILPGVDIRGDGGYLVGCYSLINNRRYVPGDGVQEVQSITADGGLSLDEFTPDLAPAPAWLLDLLTDKGPVREKVFPDSPEACEDAAIAHPDSYLEAVLLGERQTLLAAVPGTRNHALNRASFKIGLRVGQGLLSFDDAESWLTGVASHMQDDDGHDPLDEWEIQSAVRSGLEAGASNV